MTSGGRRADRRLDRKKVHARTCLANRIPPSLTHFSSFLSYFTGVEVDSRGGRRWISSKDDRTQALLLPNVVVFILERRMLAFVIVFVVVVAIVECFSAFSRLHDEPRVSGT